MEWARQKQRAHDKANIKDKIPPPNHPNKLSTHKTICNVFAPRWKGNLKNWNTTASERMPTL